MGDSNHMSKINYSRFDSLSTDTLNEILTQGFLLSEDEAFSIDEIVYIAELIAKRQKDDPDYRGMDAHESWKIFTEHYMPTTSDAKSLYDDSDEEADNSTVLYKSAHTIDSKKHIRHRRLVRAGIIAAVLAALLLAFTVTSYAFGYNPWGAIATWTDETFGFSRGNIVTAELQNELDKQEIIGFRAPIYFPDGFVQTGLDSIDIDGRYYILSYYSNNSSDNIIISVIHHNDGIHVDTYEKDLGEPEVIVRNGITYYSMTNVGHNVVIWEHNNIEYGVSSNISKEEVLKIVYSMEV